MQKMGQAGFIDPCGRRCKLQARPQPARRAPNKFGLASRWELLPQAPGLPSLLIRTYSPAFRYRTDITGVSIGPEGKGSSVSNAPDTNEIYEVTEKRDVGGYLIPKEARLSYYLPQGSKAFRVNFVTIALQKARRGNDLLTAPPPPHIHSVYQRKDRIGPTGGSARNEGNRATRPCKSANRPRPSRPKRPTGGSWSFPRATAGNWSSWSFGPLLRTIRARLSSDATRTCRPLTPGFIPSDSKSWPWISRAGEAMPRRTSVED